ncbi:FAD binding domain-containing protein [Aspergillus avenaceus]|uniref:FAD binding domain-containing protein n=1 Tax=Aspergillus avenaceus TaxID=36643 RepID=A0A5N6TTZ7_ASPAV|nr:FAD binding domain-containing protein [Aspergillus avenaceus]
MNFPSSCGVLVIGGGNAGFCAAISAAQVQGAGKVVLIDKCPSEWAGGNSYFTAGAFRTVHNGLEDLLPIVNNVDTATAKTIDLPPYTEADFTNDMIRVTGKRTDKALCQVLVNDSNDTVKWLANNGVRFQLSFNRQAYKVNGRTKFWGGLALKTQDGGKGLIQDHLRAASKLGIDVFFSTSAVKLIVNELTGMVQSVVVIHKDQRKVINTDAVVLAAGGFEANPRMRAQFLGPHWDAAFVRGTPYNSGDCLEMAIRDVSAKQAGNWSGCHCVAWDANAPTETGDREISNEFTKSGYPLGIMINRQGSRFVDEGSDLRNYTYAMIGRQILHQPGHIAFQVWDSRTVSWLREEEYRPEVVQRITASSISELAEKCAVHGLEDKQRFERTIREFNHAVYESQRHNPGRSWDPSVKDGLTTQSQAGGLEIPKSNWAVSIDQPPFLAVKVSAGITFTFGGLAINPRTGCVISSVTNQDISGLFCAGEMLGGLFYDNYPGGSGLTSGAVFGRRAGEQAAYYTVPIG